MQTKGAKRPFFLWQEIVRIMPAALHAISLYGYSQQRMRFNPPY